MAPSAAVEVDVVDPTRQVPNLIRLEPCIHSSLTAIPT